ncbi:uncharacterized protein LOC104420975 [Eucalyptus grandis]|uniref:Uncharacterized protein n=2 Tax=Eucalyptus grandis TaxID=71139 RepID=A0ACC3J235_EUCGR|nr:uncharacterized protein LOC104420975 [Eucalyptus grandis]KAK3407714.1 hypothetical protein EUGRSUZ_J00104 [Eucalyptus grandis]
MKTSFCNTHVRILGGSIVSHQKADVHARNLAVPSSGSFLKLDKKQWNGADLGLVVRCASSAPGPGPVAEVVEETEWNEMRNWSEKCSVQGGVELLECLEREAIMGDDEGKEPTDYSRRARIFDKSSEVFQALKERETETASP